MKLREAVTEVGPPEDSRVAYPVVRVVSSLRAAREANGVIDETAGVIQSVLELPQDQAVALLEAARIDAATLAQSLR